MLGASSQQSPKTYGLTYADILTTTDALRRPGQTVGTSEIYLFSHNRGVGSNLTEVQPQQTKYSWGSGDHASPPASPGQSYGGG